MKRKSPVRHKVRSHTRQGKRVRSFERGKGIRSPVIRKTVHRQEVTYTQGEEKFSLTPTQRKQIKRLIRDNPDHEWGFYVEEDGSISDIIHGKTHEIQFRSFAQGLGYMHYHPRRGEGWYGSRTASLLDIKHLTEKVFCFARHCPDSHFSGIIRQTSIKMYVVTKPKDPQEVSRLRSFVTRFCRSKRASSDRLIKELKDRGGLKTYTIKL